MDGMLEVTCPSTKIGFFVDGMLEVTCPSTENGFFMDGMLEVTCPSTKIGFFVDGMLGMNGIPKPASHVLLAHGRQRKGNPGNTKG